MAIRAYCYRMGQDALLLDEAEWAELAPYLSDWIQGVKEEMQATGVGLEDAHRDNPKTRAAMAVYQEITGETLAHPDFLWVSRASMYGRVCDQCGVPFRTPRAKLCAACGQMLPAGELAGPLMEEQLL